MNYETKQKESEHIGIRSLDSAESPFWIDY